MSNILRSVAVLCLCFPLFACNGSSSTSVGSNSASLQYDPTVTENFDPVTVLGLAAKGLMINAKVTVYSASDSGPSSLVLGMGSTNEAGEFQIAIPSAYQGALLLEVSANTSGAPSLMRCDRVDGCGEAGADWAAYDVNQNQLIDFGESFPMPSDFVLRAAGDALGGHAPITLHVSPLTHLASALAEASPSGFNKNSIASAYSQVANLFGLSGDLRLIKPLDVTNNALSSNDAQMRYSLLASSFFGLVENRNELATMMNKLSTHFAAQNGQLLRLSDGSADLGLDKVLAASVKLGNFLETRNSLWARANVQLRRELANLRLLTGGSAFTEAKASELLNVDALDQAKAMVDDLLNWGDTLNLNDQNAFGFDQATSGLNMAVNNSKVSAAFMAAAKYTPVLAVVPLISSNEEAINLVCGQMSGFSGTLCQQFFGGGFADLNCNATPNNMMCKTLASSLVIPVPTLEKTIKAEYSVLYQRLKVKGTLYDQAVDLTFTLDEFDMQGNVLVNGKGTIKNELSTFYVDGGVGLKNQGGDANYQGVSDLTVAVKNADGSEYSYAQHFGDTNLSEFGFEMQSDSGDSATVTVLSDSASEAQSLVISQGDERLAISQDASNPLLFSFSSQSGVNAVVDLSLNEATVGAISLGDVKLADIINEAGELFVLFNDGERKSLAALML